MAGESFWLRVCTGRPSEHCPLTAFSCLSLSLLCVCAALPITTPNFCLQVMVGRNFGSYVTFEEGHYIYFYIAQTGFVVFAA